MFRSLSQQIVRAAMVASLSVAIAGAQSGAGSDFTGPGGGGAGLGASIAPAGLPSGSPSGPLSVSGASGLGEAASTLGSVGDGGFSLSLPAGGSVVVSPSDARAIAAVLNGGGASAALTLQGVLVGEDVPAGAAGSLSTALAAFGSTRNLGNLALAIRAFNAAIDAGPSSPGPATLAIRFVLASASR